MKFVAAYLLASLGADAAAAAGPRKEDVRRLLGAVGAEVEEDRLDLLFASLEAAQGVAELVAAGREQLAYAPPGGAAAAAVAGPGVAGAGADGAEAPKVEEKKKVEEEDGFMLDLFG